MPRSLSQSLAEYPRIMLEALAEGWGIALTDEQTPEIVELLAAEMVRPDSLRRLLRRLSDAEREALAYVAALGQVKAHVMTRKYGSIRRLGPGRLEWERAWRQPISAAERLWFLGLLYREYGVAERYHGEMFYVPPEIRTVLPPMEVRLPAFHAEIAPNPPAVQDDGDALARDAFVILSYVRKHQVPARKGGFTARELAALRPRLAGALHGDRLRFLQHVLAQVGLLGQEERLWKPTPQAAAWLKAGDIARRRMLYQAWLEDADWNELWMIPELHCEETGWRNDAVLARKGVVRYLEQCPVGSWVSLASFVASVRDVDPDFMRPDGDYDSWYIRDAQRGQYLTGFASWDKVEGTLIRYLLEQPLRWLGVVAIGRSQAEAQPYCFMLTAQGAAVLGLQETKTGPFLPLVVQPDLSVLVPPKASWYDRFLLERFARWVEDKEGTACYRIDAASLRACLASGVTMGQILAFLRRATHNRLPQAAVRALQRLV